MTITAALISVVVGTVVLLAFFMCLILAKVNILEDEIETLKAYILRREQRQERKP